MKLIKLIGIGIAHNFPRSSHVTEPSNEIILWAAASALFRKYTELFSQPIRSLLVFELTNGNYARPTTGSIWINASVSKNCWCVQMTLKSFIPSLPSPVYSSFSFSFSLKPYNDISPFGGSYRFFKSAPVATQAYLLLFLQSFSIWLCVFHDSCLAPYFYYPVY